MVQHWKKFLNLNRNGKYRHPHVNVNWHYTFLLLNRGIEDKIDLTYSTSIFSSKCKKHEIDNIIQETKEFFEGACNFLLINTDKDPIIDDELVNKMTFWDRIYSETKITFIDLIKVLLRNFIFEKSWSFWQKEKERRLKINLKKVKENLNKDKYINSNRKINQLNLFSGLESL
ncbi:hypothetical protein RhiirA4_550011 [Rhizophagus irregularis]|uniref:Uncharacterized protein n=1 Tax=Rhizophagus irregularis TaxID=588596 RepID=A0A2I1HHH4_9GLOM|nr:hypothetical protein RhiirA4_550011 [Rhizophagus irregularis]